MHFIFKFILFLTLSFNVFSSERVKLVSDPHQALHLRWDLMTHAQNEILISTYAFSDNVSAMAIVDKLLEATRRGVKVKILADRFLNAIPEHVMRYMANNGIEFYVYHPFLPFLTNPRRLLHRAHEKLFIVDSSKLVMGDRNIGDQYFGLSTRSFIGRDVYIEGESALHAKDYFNKLIQTDQVIRVLPSEQSDFALNSVRTMLNENRVAFMNLGIIRDEARARLYANLRRTTASYFVHDEVNQVKHEGAQTTRELLRLIENAQESIVIENAYVAWNNTFKEAITRALARGVRVTLFTNSRESTNQPLVHAVYHDIRQDLAAKGATIWEHPGIRPRPLQEKMIARIRRFINKQDQGASLRRRVVRLLDFIERHRSGDFGHLNSIHSKTMLIDNHTVVVSSYNFDRLSMHWNREVLHVSRGQELAADLSAVIQTDMRRFGYLLTARGGNLYQFGDQASCLYRLFSIFGYY